MRHKIRRIHFVGIGGVGMAGLAEVMRQMGYVVSGSDEREQPALSRLRAIGVNARVGHDAAHVRGADCVVYSSAIPADNPERQAAAASGAPVVPRAQMLGELMRFKPGIAVAGTHGKTTVASMIAAVLFATGRSPTRVIGGRLRALEDGKLLGDGEHIVVEADESDASFLHLQPVVAVVTNIDNDHLEAFGDDIGALQDAFAGFLGNLPFYGAAVLCVDDAPTRRIAEAMKSPRQVTYGFAADAEIKATSARVDGAGMAFSLSAFGEKAEARLGAVGRHNVQNALAAVAVGLELGIGLAPILRGLEEFGGVRRRLESHGEILVGGRRVLLIDDYAHHPTEIAATISALRAAHPSRRLLLVFQPHRYSRTRRLLAALAMSVAAADAVVLTDVCAAGEAPPAIDCAAELFAALPAHVEKSRCPTLSEMPAHLAERARDGDLLVTMGAGNIGSLAEALKREGGNA